MPTRRDRNGHGLTALRVTGALLPPDFLQTIARLDAPKQSGADYGLSRSLVLKDEIARYWRIANDLYAAYVERRQRTDLDAKATGVDEWLVPLFKDVFGYSDLAPSDPIAIDAAIYPITHLALSKAVPLLLTTRDAPLDRADPRFGDEGRRRAPYGVMQELLNADDTRLWGFVSNGIILRLLRDNPSLTRPAYIEADLERIFEEQIYADFAALWLTVHASRLRRTDGKTAGCILELWRTLAHETGERALEHLRDGVTTALRELGNGFLRHADNDSLRTELASGSLTPDSYFQELLRLVYRLLFLFAVEDRHLLHAPLATDEQRTVYNDGYAVGRLRERALHRRNYDRHADLWRGLQIVFTCLDNGAPSLGLPALGGLFSGNQCTNLDVASICNEDLLTAIRALTFFRTGGVLARVNYRDMGTEELGSVYESLLELHPFIDVNSTPWKFGFLGENSSEQTKGSARKVTGSYYTPAALVSELVTSALDPVIAAATAARPADPRDALLSLKVLDPACGSGHFLLAAARRIAAEIARLEAGSDTPDEPARQHALREVVQHCIYGVDRNPLAVELCKTALWIEAVEPGKPLTFLDSHIRLGDSLIGILNPSIMSDGIPDDAYDELLGDDPTVCRSLKRQNRSSSRAIQGDLFDQSSMRSTITSSTFLDAMPEDTIEEIAQKYDAWKESQRSGALLQETLRANLFTAAFYATKTTDTLTRVPTTEALRRIDVGMPLPDGMEQLASDIALQYRFFHWHLAFSEIIEKGGFDVVLGNPPWDVSQLSETEYFASRAPHIVELNSVARKRAIADLRNSNPRLWDQYQDACRTVQSANSFARGSERFALTARGKVNSYALFAETFLALVSWSGRAGVIVPTGIATDNSTKAYFDFITSNGRLVSLLSFENEEFIFPAVHHSVKFCLLTLRGESDTNAAADYVFFARRAEDIHDPQRRISLTASDISRMNPNTRTAVLFRSRADAELTRKIYTSAPVLIDQRGPANTNPWRIEFRQGLFNMTSDRKVFRTAVECEDAGAHRRGTDWIDVERKRWIPLYEGKMIDLYDHRAASYEERGDTRGFNVLPPTTETQHADPSYEPRAYYWVTEDDANARIPMEWPHRWLLGFRDVSNPLNERTFIPSILPLVGAGHTLPLIFSKESPELVACLLANLSSIVIDYVAREKIGGFHVSFFYLEQLPILPPSAYEQEHLDFINERVLRLTYTSKSLAAFAESLGYSGPVFRWDSEERQYLRAELDAYIAKLYNLTRDELRYILDPSDVNGIDYPSETFRVLKQREIKEYGEYRTARLTLNAWDAFEHDVVTPITAGH